MLSRRTHRHNFRSEPLDQPQRFADGKYSSPIGTPQSFNRVQKTSDSEYQALELGPFTRQLLNERMDALTRDVAMLASTDPRRRVLIGELLRLMNLANTLRKNR